MQKELLKDAKYQTPNLTIPIEAIEQHGNLKVRGVIHVGANYGEESNHYRTAGVDNVIWIEPLEFGFAQLGHLEELYGDKIFNCAISDYDGEAEMFHVHNEVSSSLLEVGRHNEFCLLHTVDKPKVKVYKLDTLIKKNNIDINNYNMLNVDSQGAEHLVLSGCEENLDKMDVLYLELNEKDVYIGAKDKDEIIAGLREKHFTLTHGLQVNALQYEGVFIHDRNL